MTKDRLATRLKNLREEVGLDQDVISRALEIPRTAVTALELGQRDIGALELDKLCRIYRISPNEILGWKRKLPNKGN